MKKIQFIILLLFVCLQAQAQFYKIGFDSVKISTKLILGTVANGTATDSILTIKNQRVFKVSGSGNYLALTGAQTIAGTKTFTSLIQAPMYYLTGTTLGTASFFLNDTGGDQLLVWQRGAAAGGGQMQLKLPPGGSSYVYQLPASGKFALTSDLTGGPTAPTIALGATSVVGTGATVSIIGNNVDGVITLTTGTGLTAGGGVFTVTMGGGFSYATSCTPTLQINTTSSTSNVALAIGGHTSNTWSAFSGAISGSSLSPSTTYKWNYHNGGY